MGTLNWRRVILGGLLAGTVINAGEFFAAVFLRKQYQAAMQALGRSVMATASDLVLSLLVTFGVGIFAVWLYAAIRPRYGAGPRTAVIAAVATWLIQGSSNLRYAIQGLFPLELLGTGAVIAFAEYVLGTLVGARLYRETAPHG
jgi:hypothetical protein